jgi:anti-anti-sigma regulatory factor
VSELRDGLIAHLKAHQELILDLNEVTDCDTAGVQLLYSARITAESEDKPFVVRGASPQLINAVTFVGLNPSEVLNFGEGV